MKTCGIIAEYNPLHKGHIYHIEKTKERSQCDCLIVLLSNHFSQRGLPSIMTIEDKTKLALQYGANLVLELPAPFACQSANYFAKYAIESLNELNIDYLCFGSETNDVETLEQELHSMKSIHKNCTISMNQNLYQSSIIKANDILALQYIKYCRQYHIEPISILRNEDFKSATQTRKEYFEGISQFNDSYFLKEQNWNTYYPYLRNFLILTNLEQLSFYFLVTEGIEHRLQENAKKYENWNDFLEHTISKTYTRARIQRTCFFIYLQITKEQMQEHESFHEAILLGFDSIGKKLLSENKEKHIISKFNQLDPFLQDVEIKCQYVTTNTFKHRKVIQYDRY